MRNAEADDEVAVALSSIGDLLLACSNAMSRMYGTCAHRVQGASLKSQRVSLPVLEGTKSNRFRLPVVGPLRNKIATFMSKPQMEERGAALRLRGAMKTSTTTTSDGKVESTRVRVSHQSFFTLTSARSTS